MIKLSHKDKLTELLYILHQIETSGLKHMYKLLI